MIITKPMKSFSGSIEYSYSFADPFNERDDNPDDNYKMDKFESLEELLQKMSGEHMEEIKTSVGADKIWISGVSFRAKSEDGGTTSDISLFEHGKKRGVIATNIENKDIDNRLLQNVEQIRKIAINALEQYPIAYR